MENRVIYKPVEYKQYDFRWGNIKYDNTGISTIKSAGCGPTCCAMVIATLVDSKFTPKQACSWSLQKGYKYPSGGTYYGYIKAQLAEFGIEAKQLNSKNVYKDDKALAHIKALNHLKSGGWMIVCMGPGNWTKGGHYILVYGYKDGYVYINDPASGRPERAKATWDLLKREAKYYFPIYLDKFMIQEKEILKATATKMQVMWVQSHLNAFAKGKIDYWVDLEVDGVWGRKTAKGIEFVRKYLGWTTPNNYKCTEKLAKKIG